MTAVGLRVSRLNNNYSFEKLEEAKHFEMKILSSFCNRIIFSVMCITFIKQIA